MEKGDSYFQGVYLEKIDEKRQHVQYKELKTNVYLNPAVVFCPAVAIDPVQLTLPIGEYLFLCDSV